MQVTIKFDPTEAGLAIRLQQALETVFPHLPYKNTRDLANGLQEVYYRFSEHPQKH